MKEKKLSSLASPTEFNFDEVFSSMKIDNWNYSVLRHLKLIEQFATQAQRGEAALWLIEQEPSVFDTTVEIFCCNYIKDPAVKKHVIDFCKNNTSITDKRKQNILSALSSDKEYTCY